MGKCNCKTPNGEKKYSDNKFEGNLIIHYTFKIIGFVIGLLLLPLIMLIIVWFMFDTIVLNRDVDLAIIMKRLIKFDAFLNKTEDELEEESDEFNEDDYIAINVEEITSK